MTHSLTFAPLRSSDDAPSLREQLSAPEPELPENDFRCAVSREVRELANIDNTILARMSRRENYKIDREIIGRVLRVSLALQAAVSDYRKRRTA